MTDKIRQAAVECAKECFYARDRIDAIERAMRKLLDGYVKIEKSAGPTIEDGFGNVWSAKCAKCGRISMQVVRPGKIQCGYCG